MYLAKEVDFSKMLTTNQAFSELYDVIRAGLFGSGSGLKLTKILGLIRAWDVLFVLGAQKCNQNNLPILQNFSDPTYFLGFFGH